MFKGTVLSCASFPGKEMFHIATKYSLRLTSVFQLFSVYSSVEQDSDPMAPLPRLPAAGGGAFFSPSRQSSSE